MSEGMDEIRALVAAERGLSPDAAAFLTGSSLAELEASADGLVALVSTQPSQEERPDLLTAARAEKARRKQELLTALGRKKQPRRDALGRYAGSFDGGARRPVPAPADPEAEHASLVGHLALQSRTHSGSADVGRNL